VTVTIIALGSQGDVVPYLGIARELLGRGRDACVVTHETYRSRVEADGLAFRPLPMDPREAFTPAVADEIRRGPRHAARALENVFGPWSQRLAEAMDDHLADADAAVLSTLAWPAVHSAIGRGIPAQLVPLQPLHPTRDFAPPSLTPASRGGLLNRLLGRLVERRMVEPHLGEVNLVRGRHGLAPVTVEQHLSLLGSTVPVSYAFSRHLVPRPRDWPDGCDVVGFLDPGVPSGWQPDARLDAFLRAGEAPVFIGFGSTAPAGSQALAAVVQETVRRLGVRAVVQRGWAGLEVADPYVHVVDDVPHGWLFPRMQAVVHHAGAGTTAAALRAGVPSVPVPVALDQGFWAARLCQRGAATGPIPARSLSSDRLSRALSEAITRPSVRDSALRIGAAMSEEDAARSIVDRLLTQVERR